MPDHDHEHGPETHEHFDYMTGPADSDVLDGLLEAQQRALGNGIIHLTGELEAIRSQHARLTELIAYRAEERRLMELGRAADGA